jgi:hypothetical protein
MPLTFRKAASAARHSTSAQLAPTGMPITFRRATYSCAAFGFGLARSNLSLNIQYRMQHLLRPSSLQLEPECPARFVQLRGIQLRPSSLQLEPECSVRFADLLQLRGILLWPSSLQLEPECPARFAEMLFSCAAFHFGLARSNLSLNMFSSFRRTSSAARHSTLA